MINHVLVSNNYHSLMSACDKLRSILMEILIREKSVRLLLTY